MADVAENELLDYEEEDQAENGADNGTTNGTTKKEVKGAYVSIHSSGFRDFLLKPELLRSIVDNGVVYQIVSPISNSESNNLFVTSKNVTKNSPIHEFKVLHNRQKII